MNPVGDTPPSDTLKLVRRGGSGQATVTLKKIYTDRWTKEETELEKHVTTQKLKVPTIQGPAGISGVSYGLTIPGPKNSYMTARIDVAVYLPHGEGADAARRAVEKAAELVQEKLERHAADVTAFFDSGK